MQGDMGVPGLPGSQGPAVRRLIPDTLTVKRSAAALRDKPEYLHFATLEFGAKLGTTLSRT